MGCRSAARPRVRAVQGDLLIADKVDGTVTTVDAETGKVDGRPVLVSHGARLTDADRYGGRLFGVDSLRSALVTLGAAATLARAQGRVAVATAVCPRS